MAVVDSSAASIDRGEEGDVEEDEADLVDVEVEGRVEAEEHSPSSRGDSSSLATAAVTGVWRKKRITYIVNRIDTFMKSLIEPRVGIYHVWVPMGR